MRTPRRPLHRLDGTCRPGQMPECEARGKPWSRGTGAENRSGVEGPCAAKHGRLLRGAPLLRALLLMIGVTASALTTAAGRSVPVTAFLWNRVPAGGGHRGRIESDSRNMNQGRSAARQSSAARPTDLAPLCVLNAVRLPFRAPVGRGLWRLAAPGKRRPRLRPAPVRVLHPVPARRLAAERHRSAYMAVPIQAYRKVGLPLSLKLAAAALALALVGFGVSAVLPKGNGDEKLPSTAASEQLSDGTGSMAVDGGGSGPGNGGGSSSEAPTVAVGFSDASASDPLGVQQAAGPLANQPRTVTVTFAGDCTLGTDEHFGVAGSFPEMYDQQADPPYLLAQRSPHLQSGRPDDS